MPFLGSTPADQYQSLAKQTITGDGSTAYTLNRSVTNAYDMEVFINNVRQEPDTSYTASGNTITFTAAVTASDSCYLIYQGQSVGSINPPANSVGGTQIQNTSVTTAHLHTSLDLSSKTLTMPAGHVIQTITSASHGSAITSASTSLVGTGETATITPKYNNSIIMLYLSASFTSLDNSAVGGTGMKFFRSIGGGSYSVVTSMASSAQTLGFLEYNNNGSSYNHSVGTMMVSDSPATTSAVTYQLYFARLGSSNNASLQKDWGGTHFHLMEIAQ